eukprot:scaffold132354_cov32-Tisochrysis_lutea.AAC.2
MVDVQVGVVTAEPLLACIDHRLGEGANNAIAISVPGPLEGQFVQIEVGEVGLRLGGRRGTKTLVVLDRVACRGRALFFAPSLVLVECEERDRVPALSCFYQRRHKLAQEVVLLQESGPVAVQEVDDQALDVRAIMVLDEAIGRFALRARSGLAQEGQSSGRRPASGPASYLYGRED